MGLFFEPHRIKKLSASAQAFLVRQSWAINLPDVPQNDGYLQTRWVRCPVGIRATQGMQWRPSRWGLWRRRGAALSESAPFGPLRKRPPDVLTTAIIWRLAVVALLVLIVCWVWWPAEQLAPLPPLVFNITRYACPRGKHSNGLGSRLQLPCGVASAKVQVFVGTVATSPVACYAAGVSLAHLLADLRAHPDLCRLGYRVSPSSPSGLRRRSSSAMASSSVAVGTLRSTADHSKIHSNLH